jgi:excisionase family DNA binding protein
VSGEESAQPQGQETPEILTVPEAAAFLRVKEETLRELARQGKIPCGKVGGEWRFSRRALLRMLGEQDQ